MALLLNQEKRLKKRKESSNFIFLKCACADFTKVSTMWWNQNHLQLLAIRRLMGPVLIPSRREQQHIPVLNVSSRKTRKMTPNNHPLPAVIAWHVKQSKCQFNDKLISFSHTEGNRKGVGADIKHWLLLFSSENRIIHFLLPFCFKQKDRWCRKWLLMNSEDFL